MAKQLAEQIYECFDKFECQFCLDKFKDPRVLNCLHSFCKLCAEKLLLNEGCSEKFSIKCPTCSRVTEVPGGQVENLQVNFILNNLMSAVAVQEHIKGKDSTIPCDDCTSDDPAVVRCITCCLYLCEICSQGHNRRKSTSNHKLIRLEELKSVSPSAMFKPVLCKVHDGMYLKLYCESCEETICRDCTLIQHRDHKYHFVKNVCTKEKNVVTQLLEETKTKQTLFRDALNGVMEMKSLIHEAGRTVTEKINATVDSLIQAVETCRKTLLKQAREIEQGKLKRLDVQKEEIEVALSSVTSSVEFTEKALRDGSQVDVLSVKKYLIERLHKLNTDAQLLKPCTDDVISYHVKPANKQEVLNALGWVSNLRIEPARCKVKTEDEVDALKVWKKIKISILVNDQHGREMLEPTADVSVVIKSPNDQDRTQKLELTNKGDGSYHGVYIPHVPGVYGVFVTVSGAEIPGSPFEWCVKDSVNPKKTTLQMEAGKAGVVYNTLVNQTRDFIVVTRDSKGDQIREDGALINVEIEEPNNLDSKVVPVQDCGDGRYTFSYKPVCVGNYQVSVKVDGTDIRSSPFTWGVEQWHLVARNREDSMLIFSQNNMTVERRGIRRDFVLYAAIGSCGFTSGCHSWKVKRVSGDVVCLVGVTDCNVEPVQQENTWFWVNGSKRQVCNGKYTDEIPSNIPVFKRNDVIIVYLDNDMTLTIHHLASDKTDTFILNNTTLYPYFDLVDSKVTLLD